MITLSVSVSAIGPKIPLEISSYANLTSGEKSLVTPGASISAL